MRAVPWWRHLGLAGLGLGLAASATLESPAGWPLLILAAPLLALARPRPGAGSLGDLGAACWALLVVGTAALLGLGLGGARLAAIDSGAAAGSPGSEVVVTGFVSSAPRTSLGELRFPIQTAAGRLLVSARPGPDPAVGERLSVRGRLAEPEPWRAGELRRLGAALELRARRIRTLAGGRSGPVGYLDRARGRAEAALAAGLDSDQSALARGFVLGQDDRIDERRREEFRRSGLAHLLAVSGQNVMLLAILAGLMFALAGLGPRARLVATLVLIAAYVPLAGGGPSIQRAGVMGAAGILTGLSGRASDRAYLVLLAAAVTLAMNPHAGSDVGWQLSFVAVVGIALWAGPLRDLIAARLDSGPIPGRLARPLAEGAALTLAATVATGPLMALHFEAVPVAALPANLLVLPAVAPVMWLGMLAALAGQLPWVPTAPLGAVEGPLLDYIAAIAALLSRPEWAVLRMPAPSGVAIAAAYLALLGGLASLLPALRRRDRLSLPRGRRAALAALGLVAGLAVVGEGREHSAPAGDALLITAIDVGQGDAILLNGAISGAVLVDTGPPGSELVESLRGRGVERLEAVFITHDQLDHSGGLAGLLRAVAVRRLLLARPAPSLQRIARAGGARVEFVGEGAGLSFGPLALQVLAPRPGPVRTADPNADSLVMEARFAGWSALLTGDAEAEARPLDPGPFDVLKLAHHGSEDAGLEDLLAHSAPRVALIGVGAQNPYGHPAPATLATLAERDVCVLRTDLGGDVTVEMAPGSLRAWSERGGEGGRCEAG